MFSVKLLIWTNMTISHGATVLVPDSPLFSHRLSVRPVWSRFIPLLGWNWCRPHRFRVHLGNRSHCGESQSLMKCAPLATCPVSNCLQVSVLPFGSEAWFGLGVSGGGNEQTVFFIYSPAVALPPTHPTQLQLRPRASELQGVGKEKGQVLSGMELSSGAIPASITLLAVLMPWSLINICWMVAFIACSMEK